MSVESQSVVLEEIIEVKEDGKNAVNAIVVESGKNTVLESVQNVNDWTSSTKNPDYNLVLILAANSGYQAKMREDEVGSYLSYLFMQRVQRNIVDHGGKGLAAIMEDIQNALHDHGRQQTVNIFNNNTRNMTIEINRNGIMRSVF